MEEDFARDDLEVGLAAYEPIRNRIRKELEIEYVRGKVKAKLTGILPDTPELNFGEDPLCEAPQDDSSPELGNLLSPSASAEEEEYEMVSSEREDDPPHRPEVQSTRRKGVHAFIDTEAECSEEEEEEEETMEGSLMDFIDEKTTSNRTSAPRLLREERDRRDKEMLASLRARYMNKNKRPKRAQTSGGPIHFEDEESLPEIEEIDLDRLAYTDLAGDAPDNEDRTEEEAAVSTVAGKFTEECSVGFVDAAAAMQRLMKQDGDRGFGFFQERRPDGQ